MYEEPKDKQIERLISRITELERRELNQEHFKELTEEQKKHQDIAKNHEIKQLKQHIIYLDKLLAEKDS